MPVGRRMPHSHHSGSVNANFSLLSQDVSEVRTPKYNFENLGMGSIGSGQEGCVKAIYICQHYPAFCNCPIISFTFAYIVPLGHFKNQTNKTNVLQRILFEIIKCREMCVFLCTIIYPNLRRCDFLDKYVSAKKHQAAILKSRQENELQ